MPSSSERQGEVTRLLDAWSDGDGTALERLVPLVYEELRGMAHRQLSREGDGHTLDTTALVHEAYVKLVQIERIDWNDRVHFFAIASRAMRRVLIDYAVRRKALKRGGGAVAVQLDDVAAVTERDLDVLLELDEALQRLQEIDERTARVVECRFFAGMTVEETAAALDVSPSSVKREWAVARAWLNRELGS
jgi:RNA polymerase sigma factor (TIGR02999 family)